MTKATKCLRPVYLLYASCIGLFVLQMSLLIQSQMHPEKTISSTEQKILGEIPFPVVFRICIKPAYNETFLKEAGYRQTWDYFTGSHHFKPSSSSLCFLISILHPERFSMTCCMLIHAEYIPRQTLIQNDVKNVVTEGKGRPMTFCFGPVDV